MHRSALRKITWRAFLGQRDSRPVRAGCRMWRGERARSRCVVEFHWWRGEKRVVFNLFEILTIQQWCWATCCWSSRWAALHFTRQSFASALKLSKSTGDKAGVLAFSRFTMRIYPATVSRYSLKRTSFWVQLIEIVIQFALVVSGETVRNGVSVSRTH